MAQLEEIAHSIVKILRRELFSKNQLRHILLGVENHY